MAVAKLQALNLGVHIRPPSGKFFGIIFKVSMLEHMKRERYKFENLKVKNLKIWGLKKMEDFESLKVKKDWRFENLELWIVKIKVMEI